MVKTTVEVVKTQVIPHKLKSFDHHAVRYSLKVDDTIVEGIHWSGRFDGNVDALTQNLARLAENHPVDFITTTESQQKKVLKKVRSEFKRAFGEEAWRIRKRGQYIVIENRDTFPKASGRPARIIRLTSSRLFPWWRQTRVAVFNMHHKKLSRRFRVAVIHGPASIELGSQFQNSKESRVAKIAWPKLGRKMRRFQKRNPDVVQIVVGDSNGDHFKEFWLHWFEEQLGAKSIWRGSKPMRGTHGKRLIDGAWIYNS